MRRFSHGRPQKIWRRFSHNPAIFAHFRFRNNNNNRDLFISIAVVRPLLHYLSQYAMVKAIFRTLLSYTVDLIMNIHYHLPMDTWRYFRLLLLSNWWFDHQLEMLFIRKKCPTFCYFSSFPHLQNELFRITQQNIAIFNFKSSWLKVFRPLKSVPHRLNEKMNVFFIELFPQ